MAREIARILEIFFQIAFYKMVQYWATAKEVWLYKLPRDQNWCDKKYFLMFSCAQPL